MDDHESTPRAHDERAAEAPVDTTSEPPADILPGNRPAGPAGPEDEDKGALSFLKELPVLILIAFGLAMLIKTFFIQAFFIPSGSMLPTLQRDDRVLVNKLVYRIRDPRRGEVVVFVGEKGDEPQSFLGRVWGVITEGLGRPSDAERDFIKRVIGLPGETIELRKDGTVFITPVEGARFRLDEPYTAELDPDEDFRFGPFTVPPDSYFVMGDNRGDSADSRSTLGPVAEGDIIGKAFVRIWPLGRFRFFRTPGYDPARALGLPVAAFALLAAGMSRRRPG